MKTIFDELQQEVKNWWISLILGILYVACGYLESLAETGRCHECASHRGFRRYEYECGNFYSLVDQLEYVGVGFRYFEL